VSLNPLYFVANGYPLFLIEEPWAIAFSRAKGSHPAERYKIVTFVNCEKMHYVPKSGWSVNHAFLRYQRKN
jgi:hypothetical protein